MASLFRLSYKILSNIAIYSNFGRNYARPQSYPELMQTFLFGRAAYTAAVANMQYLYDLSGRQWSAGVCPLAAL